MEATQPRRSTRLAQRGNFVLPSRENSSGKHTSRIPTSDGVVLPTNKENSAIDVPSRPPKKKATTSNSKPKPKRVKMFGKLSGLLALPLDIFFEITSHLHPLDLLHLSRASRHFARMFLRTENRHAWLAARRTVEGLPDCPRDISEAQYAHLLFESVCSGCRKIGRRLLFNLRVRFCAFCYKLKVTTHTMLEGVSHSLEAMFQIVPHNYSVTDSSVVEYFQHQLDAIVDEFMKARAAGSGDDFLKEKQDTMFAIIDHGKLVSEFLEELQERRELEGMRLRVTRRTQIDARIMDLGYTQYEIPQDSAAYREEIMKPKALTERAWRGIADRMGALAAARRAQAFEERTLARFKEWSHVYRAKRTRDDGPDPYNAAQTEAVAQLLSEANATIPFTVARFDAHTERIRADIDAWQGAATRALVDKLTAVYGMPRDAASLAHASAVLRCGECGKLLFAPGVMRHLHVCIRQRVLWAKRSWGYDVGLHRIARALLHHAGFAGDVSNAQVNELKGDLNCKCSLMDFLALVQHLWQWNWSCDETFRFHKLVGAAKRKESPSQAEAVVLLEMTFPLSSTSPHPHTAEGPLKDDDPCCRQCGNACFMQVDMRSEPQAARHMQATHGQAEVGEADLCSARDVFGAAQEYASAHGGQVIVTRMVAAK